MRRCSGITRGRVLNGKLYAQRVQKLIYLYLFTDCFMKISPKSLEQIQTVVVPTIEEIYLCAVRL